MKNISLILNILLLFAVGYLYVDRFGPSSAKALPESHAPSDHLTSHDIVYVKADSILSNYTYFAEKLEALGKREAAADASLTSKGKALEADAMKVQERIQRGELTAKQVEEEQYKFSRRERSLMEEQERISSEILSDGQELQRQLADTLKSTLSAYCTANNVQFVVSYSPGTAILMAPDSLDITDDILRKLNNQ